MSTESQLTALHEWIGDRYEHAEKRYREHREDALRLAVGLPALHARFTGPTPRKHYSRRDRRRRRWL